MPLVHTKGVINQASINISLYKYKLPAIVATSLDAVGSWQIVLPMPNLERAY